MPFDGTLGVLSKIVPTNHEFGGQVVVEADQEREHSLVNDSLLFERINEKLWHVSQCIRAQTQDTVADKGIKTCLCNDSCNAMVISADSSGHEADFVSSCEAEHSP